MILAALTSCDVTPEKIARWKETEKGPGKLREAVKSNSQTPAIRAQALTALAEIGLAGEALADLKAVSPADRQAIVKEAAPRLAAAAGGTRAPADPSTRAQPEAKDGLCAPRAAGAA